MLKCLHQPVCLRMCSSSKVKGQVSHQHNTTGKITVLHSSLPLWNKVQQVEMYNGSMYVIIITGTVTVVAETGQHNQHE